MDIVLLAQGVTWGGATGDAIHLRALASHLARRGNPVRVVARGGVPHFSLAEGVETHLLDPALNLGVSMVRRPVAMMALLRAARERRPDLVYSRGFGDLGEASATGMLGLPIVFEVNGDAIAEREALRGRPLPGVWRSLGYAAARRGFARAKAVVTVTDALRRALVEDLRVPADRIHLVPNAADTELFHPMDPRAARESLGLPQDIRLVTFVGNLAPWQGLDGLLRAVAAVRATARDVVLLIVGAGVEGDRLRSLAASLGIADSVRFTGAIRHADVPRHISASDLCVAPMTFERLRTGSSAMKVHEYLACGRPVVASRIPGHEFLEAVDAGRLVPPEDVAALAAALSGALADARWRTEAGRRGRDHVLRHASWTAVAAEVERVCRLAVGA